MYVCTLSQAYGTVFMLPRILRLRKQQEYFSFIDHCYLVAVLSKSSFHHQQKMNILSMDSVGGGDRKIPVGLFSQGQKE